MRNLKKKSLNDLVVREVEKRIREPLYASEGKILEHRLLSVSAEKLLVIFQAVDALLDELECREENGIDDAGTAHRNSKT